MPIDNRPVRDTVDDKAEELHIEVGIKGDGRAVTAESFSDAIRPRDSPRAKPDEPGAATIFGIASG
jgi:hypothetical protein